MIILYDYVLINIISYYLQGFSNKHPVGRWSLSEAELIGGGIYYTFSFGGCLLDDLQYC